jgi:hypothetical protein
MLNIEVKTIPVLSQFQAPTAFPPEKEPELLLE